MANTFIVFNMAHACMHAKSLQSCLTLCDPIDGSPLGSSVPEILQARILEWVAISFSKAMHSRALNILSFFYDSLLLYQFYR